jgi:fumarate reductase iron-sulfur subunit
MSVAQRVPTSGSPDSLRVAVWRGDAQGQLVEYRVPRKPSQTVLDVVTYIQRELDATLSYRFACRVGMCGSCAMTVNGVARWTCRTHVDKVAERDGDGWRLEIAPLSNVPRIKDLVVDLGAFFDKWQRAEGRFRGAHDRHAGFARIVPDSPRRLAADAGIECIGCAVCYASCDVVAWRPGFLGPAALNRAWTLVNDERDVLGSARLRAVAGDAGCHACHTQGSCTERCPKGIAPTEAIAGLKRLAARAALRGELDAPGPGEAAGERP